MANFTNDADIYSAFLASSEFGAYPFPSRTPAHEEANIFADDWSVDTQSDYLAGPTSSFRPEANLGKCSCSLGETNDISRVNLQIQLPRSLHTEPRPPAVGSHCSPGNIGPQLTYTPSPTDPVS